MSMISSSSSSSLVSTTARIEESLRKVLEETDLGKFENIFVFQLLLTRLEHFNSVSNTELENVGLSQPAIRRLRSTIDKYEREERITRKPKKFIEVRLDPEGSDTPSDPVHHDSPCLIHRDDIKLLDKLGAGSFGVVKRATWTRPNGQTLECAIKVLRGAPGDVKNDLQNEIVNMMKLSHPNLVHLYGIVFGTDEAIFMVVELCAGGALIDRLRDLDRPIPLVTKLIEYASQIASGMEYLEKMRCVHRDLAARNVLLTKNEEVIKICDFGLSRHLEDNSNYYIMDTSTPKRVPFAWCAPESLRMRQFSHKSDVWSFGVTLWELFTLGEDPWLGYHIGEVLRMVEQGKRLEKPRHSSIGLYHIMDTCWKRKPEDRPTFLDLKVMLSKIYFTDVTCVHSEFSKKDNDLMILIGDKVFVIENNNSLRWYGQNERTGKFGYFTSSSVRASNQPPKMILDPKLKPKIHDIPIHVTATPSSGSLIFLDSHGDVKTFHIGTPNPHLGLDQRNSTPKVATGSPHLAHTRSDQNLTIDRRFPTTKTTPPNIPPPIPRHSFRLHNDHKQAKPSEEPRKFSSDPSKTASKPLQKVEESQRKFSEPSKIVPKTKSSVAEAPRKFSEIQKPLTSLPTDTVKAGKVIPEDDDCCKKNSATAKFITTEDDDGFSLVEMRKALILSQAEASKSSPIIRPKMMTNAENKPESSSAHLRNLAHESMRTAIATAPVLDLLSRSPEPQLAYDWQQESYETQIAHISTAQAIPSSHATAPEPSPGSGVVIGFEHYMVAPNNAQTTIYPTLDHHDYADYNF